MPNSFNYAERWRSNLLDIYMQGTMISPFITTNVEWLSARTFHFTQMSTSGYGNHNRNGGWNKGVANQLNDSYTVKHDRDVQFLVDKADVDETNATGSIENISRVFTQTQAVPEANALFFSKVAKVAKAQSGYHSETAIGDYTVENVYGKLKGFIKSGKLHRYRAQGALIVYVSAEIMDLLERSKDFSRSINVTSIAEGGTGIETRITSIDGVPIMEVIDDEAFYDAFDFNNDGFKPLAATYAATTDTEVASGKTYYTRTGAEGSYTYSKVASPAKASLSTYYEITSAAHKINVLIASPLTTKYVPKIESIYYFAPGSHTEGDGYLYQNRSLSDVFTFPNGKDNSIDSVYVDCDTAAYTE